MSGDEELKGCVAMGFYALLTLVILALILWFVLKGQQL